MDLDSTLSKSSRLGVATALGTALGVLVLCFVFQFVVPRSTGTAPHGIGETNLNFRSLILYATAGGVHILLCIGSIIFFWEQLRRGENKIEYKGILINSAIALFIVFSIILIACYFDMKVVIQSYDARVRPLESDPRLAFLLMRRSICSTMTIQLFALFPLTLVFIGVAVSVMASFWVSHKTIKFTHRASDLNKSDIKELKRALTQLIGLTTVVFTTSTIATVTLMQIGRDWIAAGAAREAYIQNGHAMSIFWSACYSTTTVLIVVLPLWWAAHTTRHVQRGANVRGRRRSFYDQIFEVISYKSIAQAGLAALAPLFTSSVAAVFGS